MAGAAYGFGGIDCSLAGPGGNFSISDGGLADEGIEIDYVEDKISTIYGAGGDWQHSVHQSNGATITITTLKVSALNKRLSDLYAYETASPANAGQNTIHLRDPNRGDDWTANGCAIAKRPKMSYQKEGGTMVWKLNVGSLTGAIGNGSPAIAESIV